MPRRVVAVKVLGRSGGASMLPAEDRAAFEAEADAMARLSAHPSIVSIYSASLASDGRPYIAMEFCPESFRDRSKGNPSPLDQVLDAGVRLAGALETAHQTGILHRDIKPSNVLLSTTGRPVLADFGIVSLRGQMHGEGTSEAMSIPWAAPEVIARETSGSVASEIWSLGATLYTFAAGRSPFARTDGARDTRDAMSDRIRRGRYTPVPGARGYEAFDRVIAGALQKLPQQRYRSMLEFGQALQMLQRQYGYDVTPIDVVRQDWAPQATDPAVAGAPRGPVITSVQPGGGRAQRRAELARQVSDDHFERTSRRGGGRGALKPVLIGAGAAVVVLAVGAAVLWWMNGG